MSKAQQVRADIEKKIANLFIKGLEETGQWVKPWASALPPMNLKSRRPYNGVNVLICMLSGFNKPWFLTYKQAEELGGHVKKGEKSLPLIFWNWKTFTKKNAQGEEETATIPFLKTYNVFNIDQVEGIDLEEILSDEEKDALAAGPRFDAFDLMVKSWENAPKIIEGPMIDQACYVPSTDTVEMPAQSAFHTTNGYYMTLAHELIHATGHESRCDRALLPATMNRDSYSFEELIAEIGATLLGATYGFSTEKEQENSKAYVRGWVKLLKEKPSMILQAASKAQKGIALMEGKAKDEKASEKEKEEAEA